ncbi:MAG: hypothetical protein JXB39_03390 [Deltaproteobacteria bacterium]|nr:hypothetical protein [Deltaproteobacteria bacterium]
MIRWLLLLLTPAAGAAETPADWAVLNEIRVSEVLDGISPRSVERLEALLARLDPMDRLYGETAYWLAHARVTLGDREGAREALEAALEDPDTREAALALQAQMDAVLSTVDRLPFRHDMEDGRGPFVHSWLHGDRGEVRIAPVDADHGRAIRWTSRIRDRQEDQITVSFASGAGILSWIRCEIMSQAFPSFLRILVEDSEGREFATDPFEVAEGRWTPLNVALSTFHSTNPTTPSVRPRGSLRSMHFNDVTAYLSADRGIRDVWIDNLEMR